MTDGNNGSSTQRASDAPLGRDAIIGYIGILAITIYPVGLLKLWVQMYEHYIHNPFAALYAAALIPPTVASAGAVLISVLSVVISGASLAATVVLLTVLGTFGFSPKMLDNDIEVEARGVESRFTNKWPLPSVIIVVILLVGVLWLAYLIGNAVVDTPEEDWGRYWLFVAVAAAGGVVGGFVASFFPRASTSFSREFPSEPPTNLSLENQEVMYRLFDRLNDLLVKDFRRWLLIGLVVALLGVLFSTYFYAKATNLPLPIVEIQLSTQSGGEGSSGLNDKSEQKMTLNLLALSEGHWHGFNKEDELIAVPSGQVKQAFVKAEARDLSNKK